MMKKRTGPVKVVAARLRRGRGFHDWLRMLTEEADPSCAARVGRPLELVGDRVDPAARPLSARRSTAALLTA